MNDEAKTDNVLLGKPKHKRGRPKKEIIKMGVGISNERQA